MAFYRVLKNGFENPTNGKKHKKGEVIDLFHTIGNPLTEGKSPSLARSKKVDKDTAIAIKTEIERELKT
jgi:hypothetical protein